MNLKSAFQDSERAVSPVIGVILMVAITVILAAVIGTFLLGLGDSLGGTATAGISVSGDTATVTDMGTADQVVFNGTSSEETVTEAGGTFELDGERPVQVFAVADGERTLIRTIEAE